MLIPFTPYESVAKLQHNASPPSHPLLRGFPIKIASGIGLDMDTLSTMPHKLLKKKVSEFACGFPMIQLKVFVRPPDRAMWCMWPEEIISTAVPF